MEKSVSLNPENMVEGGGLWSDIDATVIEARFKMFDYGGKVAAGVPSLFLKVRDENNVEYEQYMSCGNGKFVPSADGKRLSATSDGAALNSSSNVALFLMSLVNSNFPKEKLDDGDITVIEGGKYHFERLAAPKRNVGQDRVREDGRKFDATYLAITKVIALPGTKAAAGATKGKGKAAAAPAPSQQAPVTEGDDVSAVATEAVMGVLAMNPDGITKVNLTKAVGASMKGNPMMAQVIQLVFQDAFLSEGPWEFDGKTVSMG